MKKIFTLAVLLFSVAFFAKASQPKRVIQVRLPVKKFATLIYRDTAFGDAMMQFANPQSEEALISEDIYLAPGTVLRYSNGFIKDGKYKEIRKSFLVPEGLDTIKFEVDSENDFHIVSGVKFFVQDAVESLVLHPGTYPGLNKAFLDITTGRSTILAMYQQNQAKIEEMRRKGLCTEREERILLTIAKTDFYFRTLHWADINHGYADISAVMEKLDSEKDEIQSITNAGITDVFSNYPAYIIAREKLDPKNTLEIVNMILSLGWNKALTAEYLAYKLEDKKTPPDVGLQIYDNIKKYLNGTYEDKLVKISKVLIPKLTNIEQISLLAVDGKKINLRQLIDQNANKLFLIDFWASWCKPCRAEAPFFEKNKQQFAGRNIVFMSISLDEDDKIAEWKKALKDDGLSSASHQYKLLLPKTSPLFKNFKISAIPRYGLINAKGEFVDADFLMPSDADFIPKLSRLISRR